MSHKLRIFGESGGKQQSHSPRSSSLSMNRLLQSGSCMSIQGADALHYLQIETLGSIKNNMKTLVSSIKGIIT